MSHPAALGRSYCAVQRQACRASAGSAEGGRACIILCAYECLSKRRVLPLFVQTRVPQPCRYHLLRVPPSKRPGAGCRCVTAGSCVGQAKHDEGIDRLSAVCLCRSVRRCPWLDATGNSHIDRDFSRGSLSRLSGSLWPLTVGWLPLADRCDQQPGPRVRFHWSGMAGPGFFSRVLEGV